MHGVKPEPIQFTIEGFPREGKSVTYRLKGGLYSYQVSGEEEVFTPYNSYPKAAAAVRLRYGVPPISGRGKWANTTPSYKKTSSTKTAKE
jgi:hypothetical protein